MTLQWYLDALNQIEDIIEVIKGLSGRPHQLLLKSLFEDLKVLILTKIKNYDNRNTVQFRKTQAFEKAVKTKIENRLGLAMENLDDKKEELKDIVYLGQANLLLGVKTILDDLEDAERV